DVLRLEVPMDDPHLMNGVEDIHELVGDVEHLDERDLTAAVLSKCLERVPLEEIHHEEDAAVVGDTVVEHPDNAAMFHRVGEIPLSEEALTDALVGAERGVQDLERSTSTVAMRHGIDRRHRSGAEEGVDAPLVGDHAPNTPFGRIAH